MYTATVGTLTSIVVSVRLPDPLCPADIIWKPYHTYNHHHDHSRYFSFLTREIAVATACGEHVSTPGTGHVAPGGLISERGRKWRQHVERSYYEGMPTNMTGDDQRCKNVPSLIPNSKHIEKSWAQLVLKTFDHSSMVYDGTRYQHFLYS